MIRVLGLALYGELAASTRHRLSQFKPYLSEHGVELTVSHLLDDDYLARRFSGGKMRLGPIWRSGVNRIGILLRERSYDRAIVHCEAFPFMPGWMESAMLRVPYLYDFDDAFFLKYRTGRFSLLSPILGNKFERIVSGARCVSAGSQTLFSYASARNRSTYLMPTVVDVARYEAKGSYGCQRLNIGWIGSPSTSKYLEILRAPLVALAREFQIRLTVVGAASPQIEGVESVSIPWTEATEASIIREFDVGVMPLFDDQWSRGKCAFKLVQYMACGVPIVASPVGANVDVATPECGMLASTSEEWIIAFRSLRGDAALRERLGRAGRERVVSCYSLDVVAPRMLEMITSIG